MKEMKEAKFLIEDAINEAYEQKLKEPLDFSKNKSKFTTTNIAIVAIVVIIIASVVIKVAS